MGLIDQLFHRYKAHGGKSPKLNKAFTVEALRQNIPESIWARNGDVLEFLHGGNASGHGAIDSPNPA
jgi:hypothetical protein